MVNRCIRTSTGRKVLRKSLQKKAKSMGLKSSGTKKQLCARINSKKRRSTSKRRSSSRKPRALRSKLKQNEFYSVASRKRVSVPKDDIRVKKDRVGRHRMVAKDPKTGDRLYKYIKEDKATALKRKFN